MNVKACGYFDIVIKMSKTMTPAVQEDSGDSIFTVLRNKTL